MQYLKKKKKFRKMMKKKTSKLNKLIIMVKNKIVQIKQNLPNS